MTCGIYSITHLETGRRYVGQSRSIERRLTAHRRSTTQLVGRLLLAEGVEAFRFEILERCLPDALNAREKFWVQQLDCLYPKGLNLTLGGHGEAVEWSEVSREKMRRAKVGSTQSAESRAKTAKGLQGIKRSPETRAKMSAARSAWWRAQQSKAALQIACS